MDVSQQFTFECVRVGTKLPSFEIPEWSSYEVIEYSSVGNVTLAPAEPQIQEDLHILDAFYDRMDRSGLLDKAKVKTAVPFKGHLYVVERNDGKWIRVKVVEVDYGNQQAWIMYIDISLSTWHKVPYNRLFNLESRFWDLPQRILKCQLANFKDALGAANEVQLLMKDLELLKAGDIVYGYVPYRDEVQKLLEKEKKIPIHLFQSKPNGVANIQKVLTCYENMVEDNNDTWGSMPNSLHDYLDVKLLTDGNIKNVPQKKKTFL